MSSPNPVLSAHDFPPAQVVHSLYRTMVLIREFELKAREVFRTGRMPGFIHVYVGEEAVAAGVCAQLRRDDYVASTHRGHGHALAKGVTARSAMAELLGAVDGCSGGRGGTMHLYDPPCGFLGSNGVVPPGILIASGAAMSAQLRATDQVAVAFFGDGGSNNGAFHEGINMAAAWDLPVVFVCENNMYATETPFRLATKNIDVASRAAAYKIPGIQLDGNNVLDVYREAGKAIERARQGRGPTLIECLTYRWYGHHEGDPGTSYRDKDEIASWKARDPIKRLTSDAIRQSISTEADFAAIDNEVREILEDAAQFALSSPLESIQTALQHVFFESSDR
jgi:TPP-dependent pyruvate/acetoin dehydrogenase alpha subunit